MRSGGTTSAMRDIARPTEGAARNHDNAGLFPSVQWRSPPRTQAPGIRPDEHMVLFRHPAPSRSSARSPHSASALLGPVCGCSHHILWTALSAAAAPAMIGRTCRSRFRAERAETADDLAAEREGHAHTVRLGNLDSERTTPTSPAPGMDRKDRPFPHQHNVGIRVIVQNDDALCSRAQRDQLFL